MQTFRLLLVRHATPAAVIPGAPDAVDNERPLTAEGRAAANALAARLKDEKITAVYSSPYRRARETVQPVAAMHRLTVRVLPALRERRLSATPLEEAPFIDAIRRTRADPTFALPGGETTAEVEARAWRALETIRTDAPEGVVVVGTHGGLISILRWSLGDEFSVEDALAVPMPAVFSFEHADGSWRSLGLTLRHQGVD